MNHNNIFNQIISLENLFSAWKEFKRGKRKKSDVQEFERNLENNLYCDDFIILDQNPRSLEIFLDPIEHFLKNNLKLELHPNKIEIRKLRQGIDFLGYVTLPHYRILRTKTKIRMLKRINLNNLVSYQGLLKHCKGYKLKQKLDSRFELYTSEVVF